MATKLKDVDAVMVGMGWTGAIMARELTKAGLTVVGLGAAGGSRLIALVQISQYGHSQSAISARSVPCSRA